MIKNKRNRTILQREGKPLTAREIAELTEKYYPEFFLKKSRSILASVPNSHSKYWAKQGIDITTSSDALRSSTLSQISAEIREGSGIKREKKPEKYGHKNWVYFLSDMNEAFVAEGFSESSLSLSSREEKKDEASLYPLMIKYWKSLGVNAYRIDERRASNSYGKEGNRWLFPDIVGFKRLKPKNGVDYHVGEIMMKAGLRRVEFYSVEVKKHITRSSVRADYFQAVSNSTWANRGYLVAPCIDDAALTELKMLRQMHGIGVIRLNEQHPEKSEELISPLEKDGVGADMIGRLVEENADFKSFIEEVGKSFW